MGGPDAPRYSITFELVNRGTGCDTVLNRDILSRPQAGGISTEISRFFPESRRSFYCNETDQGISSLVM